MGCPPSLLSRGQLWFARRRRHHGRDSRTGQGKHDEEGPDQGRQKEEIGVSSRTSGCGEAADEGAAPEPRQRQAAAGSACGRRRQMRHGVGCGGENEGGGNRWLRRRTTAPQPRPRRRQQVCANGRRRQAEAAQSLPSGSAGERGRRGHR
jgi:hypothetical protein